MLESGRRWYIYSAKYLPWYQVHTVVTRVSTRWFPPAGSLYLNQEGSLTNGHATIPVSTVRNVIFLILYPVSRVTRIDPNTTTRYIQQYIPYLMKGTRTAIMLHVLLCPSCLL